MVIIIIIINEDDVTGNVVGYHQNSLIEIIFIHIYCDE